jgi:hypothetical protein
MVPFCRPPPPPPQHTLMNSLKRPWVNRGNDNSILLKQSLGPGVCVRLRVRYVSMIIYLQQKAHALGQ